ESAKLSEVEAIKTSSGGLRGDLATILDDNSINKFEETEKQLLKFHGFYQQKDRDIKKDENGKVIPADFTLMLRGRIPGGILNSQQYLVWDKLADKYGNGSIRLTTRQSLQLHSLKKPDLRSIVQEIWKVNQSTMGACGDVVRNVTQAINPLGSKELSLLDPVAELLSDHFKFKSNSYIELWLGDEQLNKDEVDPIYGENYLPRKFKIGVTLAGNNSIDIYTNDMGFAATIENDKITGYFVFAGGGLGMSHTKPDTFPRAADYLGWIPEEKLISFAEAIVSVHKDYGDRTNRKRARLKYVLADKGLSWFISEVEKRTNFSFIQKELPAWQIPSYLGWNKQDNGDYSLGFHLLAGRIQDTDTKPIKSTLKEIIEKYKLKTQVTADQDLILLDIKTEHKSEIDEFIKSKGLDYAVSEEVYEKALACPAMPTCGLAFTESERVFPEFLEAVQNLINKHQLNHKTPVIRMTGCPNGCARPYSAEIGIVGQQAGGKYAIFLGGKKVGNTVGSYAAQKVTFEELPSKLDALFGFWKAEGQEKEELGDFVERVSLKKVSELLSA
ncbi:MAG TPA: NADPH-dependent assimilatory sulfite reductase hemoprotein subunit, partial [Vampirovibrionales bacterium]